MLMTTVVLFFGKSDDLTLVSDLSTPGELAFSLVLIFFDEGLLSLGTKRAVIESLS